MFKLPSVRGFPRTSNTAQVCEQVEDSRKGRQLPAHEVQIDRLFGDSLRKRLPTSPPRELDLTPTATAYLTVEERQLFIPTGERHKKKDGTLGAEHKIPFILVTVTATIRDKGRNAFYYRVSNRSTKVFDSRDNSRRPIGEVLYELHRMLPPAMADSIADSLAEWLQPPRERKPRKRKPTADDVGRQPPPIPALRSAANAVARMIADPVLDYLRQPLPYPDVAIS